MSFTYDDYANGLWDSTANTLGRVDVLSDPLGLILVDVATYVADATGDVSLADIPGGAIIAGPETPTGITIVNRALVFDPVTFTAVTGAAVHAAVLIHDTGTAATSALIAYIDEWASGVPFTPNGTDREVTPDPTGLIVF